MAISLVKIQKVIAVDSNKILPFIFYKMIYKKPIIFQQSEILH